MFAKVLQYGVLKIAVMLFKNGQLTAVLMEPCHYRCIPYGLKEKNFVFSGNKKSHSAIKVSQGFAVH